MIESIIGRVSSGENLTMQEMADTMRLIMQGHCSDAEIALLLTALTAKGESVAEVAGAALAMRENMIRIRAPHESVIDTCGTGGDGSGTFNISTAAAIVAAAAGATVAKHGNRRISSKSGSADVLAALGVNVAASVAQVEACLDQLGICFCFAPLLHASMKHVAEVRKLSLGNGVGLLRHMEPRRRVASHPRPAAWPVEIDEELWCIDGTIVRAAKCAAGGGKETMRTNHKTTPSAAAVAV